MKKLFALYVGLVALLWGAVYSCSKPETVQPETGKGNVTALYLQSGHPHMIINLPYLKSSISSYSITGFDTTGKDKYCYQNFVQNKNTFVRFTVPFYNLGDFDFRIDTMMPGVSKSTCYPVLHIEDLIIVYFVNPKNGKVVLKFTKEDFGMQNGQRIVSDIRKNLSYIKPFTDYIIALGVDTSLLQMGAENPDFNGYSPQGISPGFGDIYVCYVNTSLLKDGNYFMAIKYNRDEYVVNRFHSPLPDSVVVPVTKTGDVTKLDTLFKYPKKYTL